MKTYDEELPQVQLKTRSGAYRTALMDIVYALHSHDWSDATNADKNFVNSLILRGTGVIEAFPAEHDIADDWIDDGK